jgi:hypothetical protein
MVRDHRVPVFVIAICKLVVEKALCCRAVTDRTPALFL